MRRNSARYFGGKRDAQFSRRGLDLFQIGTRFRNQRVRRVVFRRAGPVEHRGRVERVAPLTFDRLALARRQRGEEVVEIGEAFAGKMELLAGAEEKSGVRQPFGVFSGRECHVNRRRLGLLAQFAQRPDQRLARALSRAGRDEEPASGDGRERGGDLEFRVVAAAGALVGVGPGMIEYIFALAVALEIGRCGGDQAPASP